MDITASPHTFSIGQVLSWIPLHRGMTTSLDAQIHVIQKGRVVVRWPVAGRGQ